MKYSLVTWAGVAVAALAGAVAAQGPEESREGQVLLEQLRARAFTEKVRYVLGEPVFLWVLFANESEKSEFELHGYLHPVNDFEIKVGRAGEIPKRFTAGAGEGLVPAVTFRVPARTIHTQRWTLCYEPKNPSGFIFDQPGLYTISSRMRLTINSVRRDLTFPAIQIEVREPIPTQKSALDLILNPECAVDLQAKRARDETANVWQELIEKYPTSIWAPYAKLLLAWYACERDGADYEAVAKQFEALLDAGDNFLLLDYAYYGYAACQDRLGRPLETLRWLQRLQRKFPISPYWRAGSPLFRKYIHREGSDTLHMPWYLGE